MDMRRAMHCSVVAQHDSVLAKGVGAGVRWHGCHPHTTTTLTLIPTGRPVTEFSEDRRDGKNMPALAEFPL